MAAGSVIGALRVELGLDSAKFQSGAKKVNAPLSGLHKTFKAFGIAAGAAAATAIVGMIALTRASLSNIDVLAKQARSLGLTTDAFQKMAMVAGEAGIEAGALSGMLGKMQNNLDGLSQGIKTNVESFARLGLTMADLVGLSPDEQFAKIAEKLDLIKDPAAKTALAMDVFGKSGRDAINMLSGYSEKAREASEFQTRFGIAVSQSSSDKVEAANDAVGRLGMVMEGLGNRMAVSVAPALESMATGLVNITGYLTGTRTSLEEFFGTLARAKNVLGDEAFNKLLGNPASINEYADAIDAVNDSTKQLAGQVTIASYTLLTHAKRLEDMGYSDAAEQMRGYAEALKDAGEGHRNGTVTAEQLRDKVSEVNDRTQDLISSLSTVDQKRFGGVISALGGLISKLGKATGAANALNAAMYPGGQTVGTPLSGPIDSLMPPDPDTFVATSKRPQAPGIDSFSDWNDARSSGAGGGGGGGGGGAKANEAADALAKLNQQYVDLQATVGMTDQQLRIYNETQALGKLATQGQKDEVARLIPLMDTIREKTEAVKEAMKTMRDGMKSAFVGLVTGAKSLKDAIGDLLGKFAEMLANQAFDALIGGLFSGGGKNGGGWLGKLLGFANGTPSAPGGMALVGERGPELVNLPRGSRVNTAAQTRSMMGGSNMTFAPVIDARGADVGAVARLEAAMSRAQAEFESRVVQTVNLATKRRQII